MGSSVNEKICAQKIFVEYLGIRVTIFLKD